jgi:hypothetical protein
MFVALLFLCSTINPTYCASVPENAPISQFKTIIQCQTFLANQAGRIKERVGDTPVAPITFCVQLPREA